MSDDPKIFLYQDGEGKQRHGDPVALSRRLHSYCNGDFNELAAECESDQPETAFVANARLARAVCQTFRLGTPWNDETGQGVLESRWREVLTAFMDHPEVTTAPAESAPPTEASTETQSHHGEGT
jgi:hypothetical protein